MDSLRKIDYRQLFDFWRTFAVCLIVVVVMLMLSRILPNLLSPVIGLFCAAFMYSITIRARATTGQCGLVPYAIFISILSYTFVSIIINIVAAWHLMAIPGEFLFYTGKYVPALIYLPVAFITLIIVGMRRRRMVMCRGCQYTNAEMLGVNGTRGMFMKEAHFQLRNLIILFGLLGTLVLGYYFIFYVNISINARDWYVFIWLVIIGILVDEVYFIFRYYNLYLDMVERNEMVTPDEIEDMSAKTYLRFYVICQNNVYCIRDHRNPDSKYGKDIDTPFFTKRNINGIAPSEVAQIIKTMTGHFGELRFFYGRRTGVKGHTLLRYFYFLDLEPDGTLPKLTTKGEWIDYDEIKELYSHDPATLAPISVIDTTRLSTIMLASKVYDERGFRRSGIKSYQPNFNLLDVRNSDLDFQDDKWVRISIFNSDTPLFRLKRFWRRLTGRSYESV